MSSENGFATILLMTLIPVLLAFAGVAFFTFSVLKQDLGSMNVCRAVQLEVQDKAGKVIEKILKLNPRAKRLRASEKRAIGRLEKALATGAPPAIAIATAALAVVEGKRFLLGIQQRTLIASGNVLLTRGASEAASAITKEWKAHQRPISSWLNGSLRLNTPRIAQLGLVPDYPDIAPIYKSAFDFEDKQTWLQSWTVTLEVVGALKKFLPFKAKLERGCSTSLYQDGAKWIGKLKALRTKADKFWSRGLF